MTTAHEKEPVSAATPTDSVENTHVHASPHNHTATGHLIEPGKSTGIHYKTFHGGAMPIEDTMAIYLPVSDIKRAIAAGNATLTVCTDCVSSYNRAIDELIEARERKSREIDRRFLTEALVDAATSGDTARRDEILEQLQNFGQESN